MDFFKYFRTCLPFHHPPILYLSSAQPSTFISLIFSPVTPERLKVSCVPDFAQQISQDRTALGWPPQDDTRKTIFRVQKTNASSHVLISIKNVEQSFGISKANMANKLKRIVQGWGGLVRVQAPLAKHIS